MTSSLLRRLGVLGCIAALLAWYWFPVLLPEGEPLRSLIDTVVTRGLSAAVFVLTLWEIESPVLRLPLGKSEKKPSHHACKAALLCLPWLAIAVNNLPILPLLDRSARVTGSAGEILLFALGCFLTGLFEEAAFRGLIFLSVLRRFGSTPMQVFLSIAATSGIFGLFHLVNLMEGASPVAVLMQVGYSFLIGGMCAIAMLKTGTLWVPVLLHALYNFNGYLVPQLGEGEIWTPVTIALTAVVAIAVFGYTVWVLTRVEKDEVLRCLEK